MFKENFFKILVDNKYIILITAIFLFFTLPFFQPGFIASHDGASQLIKAAARYKALLDGQFPVRWAADLNYGYGSPGLIFYYSLTGYLSSFLHYIGFSFEEGYKILSALIFILDPIIFYFFAKEIFKKEIAFISSLFYGLAPYSFLDTFVRGHLGEPMALAIIPLILFFIQRNVKKVQTKNVALGAISYALLVPAHGILSVMFTPVFIGYILISGFKNLKLTLANLSIVIFGLLLSAYKWAPAYFEGKYIASRVFVADWYKDHFIKITNIIYSPWGFGDSINKPGGLSAQVGPLHSLVVFLSAVILPKIKQNKLVFFWILVFVLAVFMSTSLSDFLWERIHLLQQFQFPWRFTAVGILSASVLSGYVLEYLGSKKILILSVVLLLILSMPMAKVKTTQSRPDAYYLNNPTTGAYHNEGTTVWTAGDPYEYPQKRVEVVEGEAEIKNYNRRSTLHTFTINTKTNSIILDNTIYFPGWRVEVDGKKVPIEFQNPKHRGLITFNVGKGVHNAKVYFGDSPIRAVSEAVSFASILFLVFYFTALKFKFIKIRI